MKEHWECRRCGHKEVFDEPQRWVEHECRGRSFLLTPRVVRLDYVWADP